MSNAWRSFYFIAALLLIAVSCTSQLVLSEILFNPAKDGYDYVELYNNSDNTADVSGLLIGNRNATGDPASLKECSKTPVLVPPGAFVLLSANLKWVKQHYFVPEHVVELQLGLPSFPDAGGTVLLMRKSDSSIADELNYSAKWHFRLLDDVSGVSLERISFDVPTGQQDNWASAASAAGYGTPGGPNSQYRPLTAAEGPAVTVSPRIFSPDNDGRDDFAFIEIRRKENNCVANAAVYDVAGRRVRYLLQNEVLGTTNRFRWDGYDDRLQKLSPGPYILAGTVFTLDGKVQKFRKVIVLARP